MKAGKTLLFTVILTLVKMQDEQKDISIGQMMQARSQVKTNPGFSVCPEAAGISIQVLNKEPLYVHSWWIPLKLWHPCWQLFISAHLRAREIGKQERGKPRKVGNTWLAPSPLGKHASSLPTQIAFQIEKGVFEIKMRKWLSAVHTQWNNDRPLAGVRAFHPR